MDEGSPCFGIVIDHLLVECGAPCRLVRPFGIADEAAVAIAVQARAIAPIAFPDQIRPAPPGGAKLLFLAGVDAPPIDRQEHAHCSLTQKEERVWPGLSSQRKGSGQTLDRRASGRERMWHYGEIQGGA